MADTIALCVTTTTLYSCSFFPQQMWRQLWTQVTFWQVLKCSSVALKEFQEIFFYLQFSHPERSKSMWKRRKSFSVMTELGISSWQTDNKSTFNILIVWFWQLSCQSRGLENQFLLLYFSLRWGRDCEAILYKAFSIQRPLNCRWYKKKKKTEKKYLIVLIQSPLLWPPLIVLPLKLSICKRVGEVHQWPPEYDINAV